MARISGVDLPKKKRIVIALTYIYGVGVSNAQTVLKAANVSPETKTNTLTDVQAVAIQTELNKFKIEGDVRRTIRFNIKRLKDIGCYRGIRHRKGLPVRGQITQKNARTRKGPKKTVANKKKVVSKT